jgi:hypothetical protein
VDTFLIAASSAVIAAFAPLAVARYRSVAAK